MNAEEENLENNVKARFWYHAYKIAAYQREQLREDRDQILAKYKALQRSIGHLPSQPGAAPSHGGVAPFFHEGEVKRA